MNFDEDYRIIQYELDLRRAIQMNNYEAVVILPQPSRH